MSKPPSHPPFNPWKFWLSSAVLFAGILTVGLIPGCAKGEEPPPAAGKRPRRIRGALLKLHERPHTEKTLSVILGALAR
jgi:hypothetical protein